MTTQELIKKLRALGGGSEGIRLVNEAADRLEQLENQIAEVTAEKDKAVEFIRYIDKEYSGYMSEEKRFSEWRGLGKDGETNE